MSGSQYHVSENLTARQFFYTRQASRGKRRWNERDRNCI